MNTLLNRTLAAAGAGAWCRRPAEVAPRQAGSRSLLT